MKSKKEIREIQNEKILKLFIGIFFLILMIGVFVGGVIAVETKKPFVISDINTYEDNLDKLTSSLSSTTVSTDVKATFISQWKDIPETDKLKILEKATNNQKKILWSNVDYSTSDDRKKEILKLLNNENKDKNFLSLWKSFEKDGKVDEEGRRKIITLLNGEGMDTVREAFNNAFLKDKFKSVEKNKDKEIVFEGFGKGELTAEGNIKLVDGRTIKPEDIISSVSKVKLSDDGVTLEYTLTFKIGDPITVTDSGNGQLTDKGYVNGKGKTEFEYPFGNGRETLKITKSEDGRNVYTLSGDGRADKWDDRNALRFVRTDEDGKVQTYFVRANDATGEVSFSLREDGDLVNEGKSSINILIPADNYDPSKPSQSDVLKSSFTVGENSLVRFSDADLMIDGSSIPTQNPGANFVIIGKDSVYINSPKSAVTVVSYDDRLANGVISLTDVNYYNSNGNLWVRSIGNNALIRRSQAGEDSEIAVAGYSGIDRYTAKSNCPSCPGQQPQQPGEAGVQQGQQGQPGGIFGSYPAPGSDSNNPGMIPGVGSVQPGQGGGIAPGRQGLGSGFWASGTPVQPGGQQGGNVNPSQGSQGGGDSGGSYGGGRQYRFPRLRAFFGRIFGLFRRR